MVHPLLQLWINLQHLFWNINLVTVTCISLHLFATKLLSHPLSRGQPLINDNTVISKTPRVGKCDGQMLERQV